MVDKIYVTIGLFFLIVQFCGYSFTPTSVRGALFGVAAGGIFTGCAAPGMRSMLSKQVGPDEQGRIFSAIATVEAITSLISQVLSKNYCTYSTVIPFSLLPGFRGR